MLRERWPWWHVKNQSVAFNARLVCPASFSPLASVKSSHLFAVFTKLAESRDRQASRRLRMTWMYLCQQVFSILFLFVPIVYLSLWPCSFGQREKLLARILQHRQLTMQVICILVSTRCHLVNDIEKKSALRVYLMRRCQQCCANRLVY